MDDNDATKLIKIAILVTENSRETTISPRNFQTAVRIMYMDNPNLNLLINTATRYTTKYFENNKIKLNSFTHYNNLVRNYIGNLDYNIKYRVGSGTIPYLCGIADNLNNQVQQFN